MDSKKPVIIKRSNQPQVKTQPRSQTIQQSNIEPVEQPEIEQPEPVVHLESLAETTLDESVYGSGWSITELMNEFNGR